MSIFTLQSVSKDFGIKEILKEASFSLEPTDKVGLIGTNGSGKSTLLKMIAGLESIDSGQLLKNPSIRIAYLPQQPEVNEDSTVLEQVFADSGEKMALVREYEELSDKLAHGQGDMDQIMNRFSTVTQRMDAIGAWDLETNAKIVLSQLGIEDFNARVGDLSGGYRKRIALATALLSEPDVLLMDEPTNHLDALSVEWLQSYLNRFRGSAAADHPRSLFPRSSHQSDSGTRSGRPLLLYGQLLLLFREKSSGGRIRGQHSAQTSGLAAARTGMVEARPQSPEYEAKSPHRSGPRSARQRVQRSHRQS